MDASSWDLVAFVAVDDLAAARTFYGSALGLPLTADQSPVAIVFDANGTALRVTAVPDAPRAAYTVLGWSTGDIEAATDDLADRGVTVVRFDEFEQDDRGIWTTPGGDRVAWFRDPAGNLLSLTQPAT